jgi:hypothetical protein
MRETRLQLKHASGWFAAGCEVRQAATLLSDSAFKLFVWICLHAERNSGRLRLAGADLTRSLPTSDWRPTGAAAAFPSSVSSGRFTWESLANTSPWSITEREHQSPPSVTSST